ncbi:nurim homolog [Stomoxys calcitrans]|uniref:nurim homolog n=1 Tax=Stomoxys calcitrans TaxID=35570 RepID=UPI0027E24960|nr:nurim homolog [Stomoxys calcitrans]
MASVKQYLVLLLSLASFVYTIYVVTQLIQFLSAPRKTSKIYTWVFHLLDNTSRLETAYGPIVFNTLYLMLFIFQHSFMKSAVIKKVVQSLGLSTAERAIYSLTSSACLHYLIRNWVTASSIILWQVDVEANKWMWWLFTLLHAFAWMVICGGSIIMDLPELMGIKQPYYDMKSYAQPLAYKSFELRHLYTHVRHPSFVGLSVILWASNLMTLDRLLLAVMLTSYMYFAWSTDHNDMIYQKCQLQRKSDELKS